jgi:hypothetical protein
MHSATIYGRAIQEEFIFHFARYSIRDQDSIDVSESSNIGNYYSTFHEGKSSQTKSSLDGESRSIIKVTRKTLFFSQVFLKCL